MRKKLLISVVLVTWLSCNAAELVLAGSFPDVLAGSEHLAAIEYLKSKGLISGYPDGSFKPDNTINRAEALKIVSLARLQLLGEDKGPLTAMNFPDVKSSDWFYPYVQKAFTLGVVEGYTDGTFKPANEITAAESWKIIDTELIKTFVSPISGGASLVAQPFTDVKLDAWYAPYLAYAKQRQFIEAKGDGSYDPERKISRADFAEAVYRVTYSEENKLDKFPLSLNWNYCNNFGEGYKVKYPFDWTKISARSESGTSGMPPSNEMIFWKQDSGNGQVSFARVYPNSAVVIVAVDKNPQKLALDKYLNLIEYGQGSTKDVITLNGLPYASIFVAQNGLQDSYFQMPNGDILIVYAQTGDGDLSAQLKEQIRYLVGSVRESTSDDGSGENCLAGNVTTSVTNSSSTSTNTTVSTTSTPAELIIADILKLVLVNGKSSQALNMIDDEILISTDTIGIGTGPVDYYYSAKLDLTMKIDRNSETILATKKTKTSAF